MVTTSSKPTTKPPRTARASEDVVEQIKEAIFSGKLAPGDRLPAERELVRALGLSRVTIREAIRTLEAAGVIRVKLGVNGGAYIAEATPKIVTDSLTTLLKLQKATLLQLAEARKVVETAIAEMAAFRADESDLAAMERALAHTREAIFGNAPYAPASVEFHSALAKAAKNPLLLSTVNSFSALLNYTLSKLGTISEMKAMALEYHQRIYAAVQQRDGAEARRLMEVHLQHFELALRQATENGSAGDENGHTGSPTN